MTPEKIEKDRADWLLDAVATSTQDRRYLRGGPEYDAIAGGSILLNGEKAIRMATADLTAENARLKERVAELTQALSLCQKTLAVLTNTADADVSGLAIMSTMAMCLEGEVKARAALKGESDE